jgi:hypothetical protein
MLRGCLGRGQPGRELNGPHSLNLPPGVLEESSGKVYARRAVRSGHVEIDGLDIVAADARSQEERPPHEYGVYVLHGAFTLGNMHHDPEVLITANLIGLSAGRLGSPVLGGGVSLS